MTEADVVTPVKDLLPDVFSRMAGTLERAAQQADGAAPTIPGFAWDYLSNAASSAIRDGLDGDVFELLARGWTFAQELGKFRDREKYPPGTTSKVYLGKHALTTEVHPVVTLYIGPLECRPITFTLEFRANFDTAALLIRDAAIYGIDAGECYVTAQLKYGEIGLHDELETKHVSLRRRRLFKTPLTIG